MEKLRLLIIPLMTVSLLANCSGGDKPEPEKLLPLLGKITMERF